MEPTATRTRRFDLRGRTLRQHAARGALVNTGFMVGLSFLGFIRGFVLAGFLVATDYGIWGITLLTMNIVASARTVAYSSRRMTSWSRHRSWPHSQRIVIQSRSSG